MASVKTQQLLEAARALIFHLEALVLEETAAEESRVDVSGQERPAGTHIESDALAILLENDEPADNGLKTDAVEVITVEAGDNIVAKEPIFGTIDNSAETARREAKLVGLRASVAPVIERGDYLEMGRVRKTLLRYGLQDDAEQITAEFIRRNLLQAQASRDVRDKILVRLEEALATQDVSQVRKILAEQVPGIYARLNVGLKPHVQVQIEGIEGMAIGKIRASFDEQIEKALTFVAAVEQEAREAATLRQQEIEEALVGNVCPKAAVRVRTLVSQIEANMRTKNFGAIRSALVKLSQPENFLAGIAHFGSVPKLQSFVTEVETVIRTADAVKRQQKKGGKRHLWSA